MVFDRSGTILALPSFPLLHGAVEFMALTLTSSPLALALIFASKGLVPYLRHHFLDKTFQGLYQVNAFDLALLIPYFVVLIILAAYGAHRYWLVYLYYKHQKSKTTEPSARFQIDQLPRVTIQLPIFNEQYVVERLLDAVCRLDYPKEKLDIQLLDDSTDETVEVARLLVDRYAALGHPVTYLHRDNREGYKAGALAEGLKTAKGEFVAIFDADFVPPPDFLMKCIHHFTDPKVGMVQTRWTHINRNYSLLTQVEAPRRVRRAGLDRRRVRRAICSRRFAPRPAERRARRAHGARLRDPRRRRRATIGRGGCPRRRSACPRRLALHPRQGPRRRADRSRRRGARHAARLGDLRRSRRRLARLAGRLSSPARAIRRCPARLRSCAGGRMDFPFPACGKALG